MLENEPPTNPHDDFLPEDPSSESIELTVSRTSALSGLERFLENFYGSLFTPEVTFTYLRSHPSIVAGTCIIILVNTLEALRLGQSDLAILLSIIPGLIGWLVFAVLLRSLAAIFQKTVELPVLLTLIAFGSTPWLLMGPALSLGDVWGTLAALGVMVWFTLWQVWAASVAIAVNRWQLLSLIPLTIGGGFIALIWSANVIKLLFSLAS